MTNFEYKVSEAKEEAERFLKRCEVFEKSNNRGSHWPSLERAALKRSAIDCGHAMRQINKSEY